VLFKIGVEFGLNALMLYCLGLGEYPFTIFQYKCEVHLIIKLGTKLSIEEICIYYMHFVCCNVYIFIEHANNRNYVICFLGEICLECSTQSGLLMKLVSNVLPYVLMSAHHRYMILQHIIYLRLLTI
jgi:hypothetical protein